jgi:signal transduction histidine kinase
MLRNPAAAPLFLIRYLLVLTGALFMFFVCQGQPTYTITHYSTANGLPSNGMKGLMLDDHSGFLWIATEAGISRYDGTGFAAMERNGKKINERTLFITQNRRREIFIGTAPNVVYKVNQASLAVFDTVSMSTSHLDPTFTLPVSEKLYRHPVTPTEKYTISIQTRYSTVMPVTDTSCLISKDDKLLYYSIHMSEPVVLQHGFGPIKKLFAANGHIFVSTKQKKILEWDTTGIQFKKTSVSFIGRDEDLLLWQNGMPSPVLISGNNAFLLRYSNGTFYRQPICTAVPIGENYKIAAYSPVLKALFLATESNGFFIIREHLLGYAPKSPQNKSTESAYYGQAVMPNGTVLTHNDQQFGSLAYTAPVPVMRAATYSSFKDGDSVLYYSRATDTADFKHIIRLCKYNFITGKTTIYPQSVGIGPTIGRVGEHIYTHSSNEVMRIEGDNLVPVKTSLPNLNANTTAFQPINDSLLAIAICRYLFSCNVLSGRIDTLLRTDQACIRAVRVYKDYLLISTYGDGIYISRNGITRPLPLDIKQYLKFAHCFMIDRYGFCWISTNNGLFKVAMADLISAYETAAPLLYYHYFGKADGMDNTEMNGGCTPCAVELPNGTLSFPTMAGLLWVDPAKVKPVLRWADIFVNGLLINNRPYEFDAKLLASLPASTNNVFFKLTAVTWENPENLLVKYRVDDQDEWTWLDEDNNIKLFGLKSGAHTLEIVKLNGFGQNSQTRKTIRFFIQRPWYFSWWFLASSLALLIFLIYLSARIRTMKIHRARRRLEKRVEEQTAEIKEQYRKLEKKDAVQTRLISIINHDIITPLKFLSATGSMLLEKKGVINETIHDETLREMTQTSKGLQLLASDILNWIKYHNEGTKLKKESFALRQLIDTVFQLLGPIAAQHNVQLLNQVDDSLTVFQYYEPSKVLVYNLVMNAINFSSDAPVTISARPEGNEVLVTITDRGTGMPQEQAESLIFERTGYNITSTSAHTKGKGFGLGYLIIRDILKLTGIRASIQSQPAEGTTVMLHMGIASTRS